MQNSVSHLGLVNLFFDSNWVTAPASTRTLDGLGPLFNATSCQACHPAGGRGQPPRVSADGQVLSHDSVSLLMRLSVPADHEGVSFDELPSDSAFPTQPIHATVNS